MMIRERLAALEGGHKTSTVGMASSSHNPDALASSLPTSTWVIDSSVTDHVTGMQSLFQSYTPNHLWECKNC